MGASTPTDPIAALAAREARANSAAVVCADETERLWLTEVLTVGGFAVSAMALPEELARVERPACAFVLAKLGPAPEHTLDLFNLLRRRWPQTRRIALVERSRLACLSKARRQGLVHAVITLPAENEELLLTIAAQAEVRELTTRNEHLAAELARKTREIELSARLLRINRLSAVGQLAAGLAHEINNPLGTIMAFTQILIREAKVTSEDLEALKYVEQAAQRCKRVIEAVVDHAAHSAIPSPNDSLDLAEVGRATLELMRPEIEASGALVHASLEIPSPRVAGTFQSLQQVARILLNNALEATRGGGRRGDVTLSTFARGDRACLSVRDNGRGIAPGLRERIFEPFFTTKVAGEAAGLGLATAERIAHAHGGAIQVESEPDLGSTFTLVLPILPSSDTEATHHARAAGD